MDTERRKQQKARKAIWIATGAYLVIVYVSQWALWFLKGEHPALAVSVALTPMIGLVMVVRAAIRAHRDQDELQRRLDAEAAIVSGLIVGLGSFAYGLARAALEPTVQPTVWALWVGPALIATWGIAKLVLRRRYQ